MQTIEVTFLTEGGSQIIGELVNPSTVLNHDGRFVDVSIPRDGDLLDVISDQNGQLCAYKVPMGRVRFLTPIRVSA